MTSTITGAFDVLIKDVDAVAADMIDLQVAVEQQNELEFKNVIKEAEVTKAELLQELKEQKQRNDQL